MELILKYKLMPDRISYTLIKFCMIQFVKMQGNIPDFTFWNYYTNVFIQNQGYVFRNFIFEWKIFLHSIQKHILDRLFSGAPFNETT